MFVGKPKANTFEVWTEIWKKVKPIKIYKPDYYV
jgi:hypothetical protein